MHSISSKIADWEISHNFKDRPLIYFYYGWILSSGTAPSFQQPIDAAANMAEFILICHYLPIYHHHPGVIPLTSKAYTSGPLSCSSENQWGGSDRAWWDPHSLPPPSLPFPCWKGKLFISRISLYLFYSFIQIIQYFSLYVHFSCYLLFYVESSSYTELKYFLGLFHTCTVLVRHMGDAIETWLRRPFLHDWGKDKKLGIAREKHVYI